MSTMYHPREVDFTVHVHDEGDEGLWAEVEELPGCFAAGSTLEELEESLTEGIGLYLSSPDRSLHAKLLSPRPRVKGGATERLRFHVVG
jgi:predicted RNase H-like HicB family nuclease